MERADALARRPHADLPAAASRSLVIQVAAVTGTGPTELAAFDAALAHAGLGDLNLIRLSSVIPPGSTVVELASDEPKVTGDWGDRHYVVYSQRCTSVPGEVAVAGVGWVHDPATGRGLFVEIDGEDEAQVRSDIAATLDDMVGRRRMRFDPARTAISTIRCGGRPVCALVIASYLSEGWM